MSIQIIYQINTGVPDFTASISPQALPDQTHNAYGVYSFDNLPEQDYILSVRDSLGCYIDIPVLLPTTTSTTSTTSSTTSTTTTSTTIAPTTTTTTTGLPVTTTTSTTQITTTTTSTTNLTTTTTTTVFVCDLKFTLVTTTTTTTMGVETVFIYIPNL